MMHILTPCVKPANNKGNNDAQQIHFSFLEANAGKQNPPNKGAVYENIKKN